MDERLARKRPYRKPSLRCFGKVKNLTGGGASPMMENMSQPGRLP